jgi:hypothetical protein
MSPVQNVWRQLVQRRLWPVAIVLVAGLAAIPLTLAKEPEPVPAPPAVPAETADSDLAIQPIVAMASADDRAKRRRVLGKRKNPFGAQKPANATKTSDKASDSVVTKTGGGGKSTDSQSGDGGGSPPAPSTPTTPSPAPAPTVPADPAPAPKTYALQELTIRFGASDDPQRQSLKRLEALPSGEKPLLIYMGLSKDGKTAIFMVDHDVAPVGDGDCRPSPEECQSVRLRVGETEFFDVKDETGVVSGQYQLDLIKIHKGSGASASKARGSTKAAAAAGLVEARSSLRSTVGRTTARLP